MPAPPALAAVKAISSPKVAGTQQIQRQAARLAPRHASDTKAAGPSSDTSITRDARRRRSVDSSIDAAISRKVRRAKSGAVFTPTLFADLGGRAAIDKALQRLVARDELRRLSRGLHDKPRHEPLLGTLWPSVDAIVAALAGKDKLRLQPTGAYAANLLGLSDQLPARVEFLTDGTSRTVKAGPMHIVPKRTTPRQMAAAGRTSGLVIQALRNLGPDHLTARHLNKLGRALPEFERRTLLEDLTLAPRLDAACTACLGQWLFAARSSFDQESDAMTTRKPVSSTVAPPIPSPAQARPLCRVCRFRVRFACTDGYMTTGDGLKVSDRYLKNSRICW
jgi:hypothetical protein